jgi:uncharacterized protein (UPF0335 family)
MNGDKLKIIVDGIERLEEKQRALLADKRRIYVEAEKAGYNGKALRRVIAERRMPDREQIVAAMNSYRVTLGLAVNDVAGFSADCMTSASPRKTLGSSARRCAPRSCSASLLACGSTRS